MTSDFLIWSVSDVENAVVLDDVRGIPDPWELDEGVSRAEGFPDDVVCTMDQENPHNTLLVDNLENSDNLIVASRRLKEFLAGRSIEKVEYLPVTVLDHRGRSAAGGDYYIIHTIGPVDCLKVDECGPTWSQLDKDSISFLERFAIDPSKIDDTRRLFRALHYEKATVIRRDLAAAIDEAGFTGIRWVELDDYRG